MNVGERRKAEGVKGKDQDTFQVFHPSAEFVLSTTNGSGHVSELDSVKENPMKAVLIVVSLFLPFSFSVVSAQLTKVTVGYSAVAAGQLPAWMAKESGIFRKNGVDVQLVYFRGGTTATMALLARETPISQVAGPAIVSASLRGADAVIVAGGVVITEWWLMTRPDIKTAEKLKRGSVAIGVFGGLADVMARLALKRLGVTPVKDVTMVQISGVPEQLSALETGRVQAAMLPPPENLMAQKRGFYNLLTVRLPYQSACVATTRTFIRENPDIVRRYVKSQVEAIHRIKTDREAALRVLAKYLALQDKEILERTYDDISTDDRIPPKQYPTLEGIKNILEPLAETDPKAKTAKPEDFVDVRFIKELDESGFIDELYKERKR
jgi:ABC-type nitrate/sulfonate/bicarbonate transport system substrate-binding protein